METQEIKCVVCGKKITDRSTNHSRMYCSLSCNYLAFRTRHGMAKPPAYSCIHNKYVECKTHNSCGTCGWNPEVEQRRKEAFAYG